MPSTATVQKLPASVWNASDPEFHAGFYKPYEAAVHAIFLLLDEARCTLARQSGDAVLSMTFRLKSPASIRGKLIKKGMPSTAKAAGACLQDVAGVRVILSGVPAIYRFARLLRSSSGAVCIAEDDYIAEPKESGYRSLHLTLSVPVCTGGGRLMVPVEIQLRTAGMDAWASLEHALCYKPVRQSIT